MKKLILILFCFYPLLPLKAQKESNLLKKHEIQLLEFLLKDTIHNVTITVNNSFNFGLADGLFTNSNILKKGKEVFIQPLGTGRLYQAINTNGNISLERKDLTVHSGVNFYSQNFFIKDTLYQYGGIGFWQIRGILNYYSPQTKQWELVQSNRAVQSFFDNTQDAVLHYNENAKTPKLYVTNSYYYPNYPSSFENAATDSCFVYNFQSRKWTALGIINPDFKKIMIGKRSHEMDLHINDLYIFQSQLDFYWINFEENKMGHFNSVENSRIRDVWLSFYNNDSKNGQRFGVQFNLGNDLYFMKYTSGEDLKWTQVKLNLNKLDYNNTIPIYSNNISFVEYVSTIYYQNKTTLIVALLVFLVAITIRRNVFKRKSIPKEVTTILYQNFFNALNIVEKELIETLYENNLKGEEVSTKTINKIIGVQQKDTLTQNKSRSDHFLKINQKFKMSTQNTESLFIKTRDKADKRQYNYSLNPLFINEIEKLIKG